METIKSFNTRGKITLISLPVSIGSILYLGINLLIQVNSARPYLPYPIFYGELGNIVAITLMEVFLIIGLAFFHLPKRKN